MDGGVLWPIARALFALIGVCMLAWVSLTWLSRRGFAATASGARLKLIERMALSPRRQLYLVRADSRVFLLGAADGGPVSLIAELGVCWETSRLASRPGRARSRGRRTLEIRRVFRRSAAADSGPAATEIRTDPFPSGLLDAEPAPPRADS